MKKILIFMFAIIVVISVIGCGSNGNSRYGGKYIVQVISLGGTTDESGFITQAVTPGPIFGSPDGGDGKFNASTEAKPNFHRILYLKVVIKDENNNEINVPDPENIVWTHDFPASEVRKQNDILYEFTSNSIGVHDVTVSYKGYSSVNKVLVYKRMLLDNMSDYPISLKLDGYELNSANPDIIITYTNVGYKLTSFTINAPGGIAIMKSQPSTWCDPGIRQDLGFIGSVPDGLTYQTQITIQPDWSAICIIKEANGTGYAKILFSQGVNAFSPGLDLYMDYSPTDQFTLVY